METKKGFVILLVPLMFVIVFILLCWFVDTQKSDYEYVDTKGEKHIAISCSVNNGGHRAIKPICILEDGTMVFDVASYKKIGGKR